VPFGGGSGGSRYFKKSMGGLMNNALRPHKLTRQEKPKRVQDFVGGDLEEGWILHKTFK